MRCYEKYVVCLSLLQSRIIKQLSRKINLFDFMQYIIRGVETVILNVLVGEETRLVLDAYRRFIVLL